MGYLKDVFEGSRIARRIGESSKAVLAICILFVRFHQFLPLMSRNFTGRRFPLKQVFSLLFLRMGSKIVAFTLLVLGQIFSICAILVYCKSLAPLKAKNLRISTSISCVAIRCTPITFQDKSRLSFHIVIEPGIDLRASLLDELHMPVTGSSVFGLVRSVFRSLRAAIPPRDVPYQMLGLEDPKPMRATAGCVGGPSLDVVYFNIPGVSI